MYRVMIRILRVIKERLRERDTQASGTGTPLTRIG